MTTTGGISRRTSSRAFWLGLEPITLPRHMPWLILQPFYARLTLIPSSSSAAGIGTVTYLLLTYCLLTTLCLTAPCRYLQADGPQVMDIGNRLELFVDRHGIESLEEVRLVLHPPRPADCDERDHGLEDWRKENNTRGRS